MGIQICYLFIFTYIFLNPCIGNIILINRPIEYIPKYYFVSHTIIAVICTVVGRIFEKNIINNLVIIMA